MQRLKLVGEAIGTEKVLVTLLPYLQEVREDKQAKPQASSSLIYCLLDNSILTPLSSHPNPIPSHPSNPAR